MAKTIKNNYNAFANTRNSFTKEKRIRCGAFTAQDVVLSLSDPSMLQEIFVEKNKFFDKSHLSHRLMKPLVGDGILFAPTNENWNIRRKTITAAFYKEKLLKMVEIIKHQAVKNAENWRSKYI